MSRTQATPNFIAGYAALLQRVSSLERAINVIGLRDVGSTTSLTSAQIDSVFFGGQQPYDGAQATDKTNSLLLVRESGSWYKMTGTLIP